MVHACLFVSVVISCGSQFGTRAYSTVLKKVTSFSARIALNKKDRQTGRISSFFRMYLLQVASWWLVLAPEETMIRQQARRRRRGSPLVIRSCLQQCFEASFVHCNHSIICFQVFEKQKSREEYIDTLHSLRVSSIL